MLDSTIKVLVVDDVALMRRVITSLLRKIGITDIHEAASGAEALQILQGNRPDVVVSDWNMPAMSGLDLLREMRRNPGLKTVPFLLVTAKGEQADIDEAKSAGVSGYLHKPFDIRAFEVEVRKVVPKQTQ